MKILKAIALMIFAAGLLAGCNCMTPGHPQTGSGACTTDSDCVPATCCHATACVAKDAAPECADVMCTMNCEPKTIDCGGGCVCNSGACNAKLNDLF